MAFLYPRHEAVLADEMGLGKTMQAIVAMRLLAHQGHVRRALLVCPKPLVTNWQREFALWAPELPVTVIEGKQTRREWLWQHAKEGVLLANYESLVRDREYLAAAGRTVRPAVIDESQRIKNRSSTTNEVVCSIPRRRSWALTGTPIENSADDLVGIFEFVSPGCLQPQMKIANIRKSVSDYILRRTKDQVLTDLPPKMFRDAEIELTAEQQIRLRDGREGRGHSSQRTARNRSRSSTCSNWCSGSSRSATSIPPPARARSSIDSQPISKNASPAAARRSSSANGSARSTNSASGSSISAPWSTTAVSPRIAATTSSDTFRDDPTKHVILMSYGAGSVGLNLQFAGYVFLFDRWWNPAVEDQAINRAHRIGATGPVTVTRFLATGTIEERINRVLEEKRELFNAVFDGTPTTKLGLSRKEIFGLFNLRFPGANGLEEAA